MVDEWRAVRQMEGDVGVDWSQVKRELHAAKGPFGRSGAGCVKANSIF